MPQPSAAFVPAGAVDPAINPLAESAGVPAINPLISETPMTPAPASVGGGFLIDAITPNQRAALEALRARRAQEEADKQAAALRQADLERRHGKLETATVGVARGLIDAVLSPGALVGLQSEMYGTITGSDFLRDFGRDLGESSNAQALWGSMAEAFGPPQVAPRPGQSAPSASERTRRVLAEQQQAWPLLAGVSRVAGMAIPALATAGVGGLGEAGAVAGGAGVRIASGAALGAAEGASGGAQAAYEDAKPLRDVLASSLLGGALGAGVGGTFAGASELVSRGLPKEALEAFAERRMVKAMGARATEINKLGEPEARRMARDVMEHTFEDGTKVLPTSPLEAGRLSLEDLAARVGRGREELGNQLGNMRRAASAHIEDAAPELRPDAAKLIDKLQKEVISEVSDSELLKSQKPVLQAVIDDLEAARAVNKTRPVEAAQAAEVAGTSFDDAANRAGKLADTLDKAEPLDAFLNRERRAVSLAERAKAENKISTEVTDFLKQAQERGAVYNGRVYRGTNETELAQLRESGQTTHTLSASSEREGAEHFAKKGGVLLEIEDHPVPVDGIPGSNTFSETLIPKGSRATITGEREVDGMRIVTVKLQAAGTPEPKVRKLVEQAIDDKIPLDRLLQIQKNLKSRVYDSRQLGSTVADSRVRLQRMERIVDELVDETVDKAITRMDDTAQGAYKALKRQVRSFIEADQIFQGAKGSAGSLAREQGNRFLSLSDQMAGAAALAGDLAGGGGVLSAGKGLLTSGVHKYAREHGSAFLASLVDGMSKRGVRIPGLSVAPVTSAAESDVLGHVISINIGGGREGASVLGELQHAQRLVAQAVEKAGPNPEQRSAARQEARDMLAQRLSARAGAYDAANWVERAPTPLQKVVHRTQILDRVGADVASAMGHINSLFPGQDFELSPNKLKRLAANANGPTAIGSLQARVRSIFEDAPPSVEGDKLRYEANEALHALSSADVPGAMIVGHKLINRLIGIGQNAREESTVSFTQREAHGFLEDLSGPAFGDAGRVYGRLRSQPSEDVEKLSDPVAAREVLRTTDVKGKLPLLAKEIARALFDAHEARAQLGGGRVPPKIKRVGSKLEESMVKAEDAVTLDGGPVSRILDHFEGKSATVPQDMPEEMVLNTIRPKMERLIPTIGNRETEEAKDKPPAQLPKSRGQLQSLYKERLEYLTQAAVSPDLSPVERHLEGLPNVPPQLAMVVANDAQERIQALLRDLPKPKQDIRGAAFDSLSSDQLRVANAMWEATEKPMSVFDDFARGAVDYDKVRYAWKQYPGLQQAAQAGFLDAVHSHLSESERANMPDRILTQVDYLLGFNGQLQTTVGREFVARIAAMNEENEKKKAGPGGNAELDLPAAQPTYTQRLASARRGQG